MARCNCARASYDADSCRSRSRKHMTTRERMFLTPVEKFRKHGIIPWKLILNVTLVALVTSQVVIVNTQESNYVQAASRNFYYYFYPSDYDFSDIVWYTYTVNDTVDAVQYAVSNYYSINQLSPDMFVYNTDEYGSTQQPTLTVTSFTDIAALFNPTEQFTASTQTISYAINTSFYGPMDRANGYPALKNFFHSLVSMDLHIPPLNNFAFGSLYRNCFAWTNVIHYDFTNRGQIQLTMDQAVTGTCDVYASSTDAFSHKGLWINFAVILLSFLHSSLLMKAILRSFCLMRRLQRWAHDQALHLERLQSVTNLNGTLPPRQEEGPPDESHSNGPALSRHTALGAQKSVQLDFHTDTSIDGGGDIFISARDTGHLSGGHSNTMVFAAGDDSQVPVQTSGTYGTLSLPDIAQQGAADVMHALNATWESFSWRDKLRFINGWAVLSIFADACNVASSALNLQLKTAHIPSEAAHSLIMALGLSFLWLGVLRYLEFNRSYFNIVLTLRRAGPRVLQFLVGVLPVFIAYTLFAVVMFSDRIPRFCDVRTAFITLFANLNGDVVRETMMAIVAYHPVVGQFFFYTFISLHIYVVLNIIIAVVEESYFITSEKTAEMEEKLAEAKHAHSTIHLTGSSPVADKQSKSVGAVLQGSRTRALSVDDAGTANIFPTTVDPLLVPAIQDSDSIKVRPDSKLTTLLRLAEWDEVVTGRRIGTHGTTGSTHNSAALRGLDLQATHGSTNITKANR